MTRIERLLGDVKRQNDMCQYISAHYDKQMGQIKLKTREWRDSWGGNEIWIYPKDVKAILNVLVTEYEKWEKEQ